MPTPGEETNWHRTQGGHPQTGGRPTQELAGTKPSFGEHRPDEWQAAVSFEPGVRRQALPVAPFCAGVLLPCRSRVWVR